jgi:inorganic phosphate transporter, PiT family
MAFVSQRKINEGTFVSLAALVKEISTKVGQYGSIAKIPVTSVGNERNDMYLASEALRFLMKDKENALSKEDFAVLNTYKSELDSMTRLGRGGDRAGVGHHGRLEAHRRDSWREDRQEPPDLRPGRLGRAGCRRHHRSGRRLWPASLDHPRVSSDVAGTMAANGLGLQMATVRNLVMAWVLTLPVAMMLSGGLYIFFSVSSEDVR